MNCLPFKRVESRGLLWKEDSRPKFCKRLVSYQDHPRVDVLKVFRSLYYVSKQEIVRKIARIQFRRAVRPHPSHYVDSFFLTWGSNQKGRKGDGEILLLLMSVRGKKYSTNEEEWGYFVPLSFVVGYWGRSSRHWYLQPLVSLWKNLAASYLHRW